MYVYLPTCLYMHPVCAVPKEARTRQLIIKNWNYKLLWESWFRCWELNPGPLQEEEALLTAEPSFQPDIQYFLRYIYFVFLWHWSFLKQKVATIIDDFAEGLD